MKIQSYTLNPSQNGQSILEVIIAMTIFSLIAAAMMAMVVGSFTALQQGGEQTEAAALAQEGIEAIRSIRDGAWNEIIYNQSAVAINSGQWVFSGEGTDQTIGQYTRTITFNDVCRDSNDDIVDCPGTYTDVHSKKAIVDVSWEIREGIINSVQRIAYLTNWDSQDWIQTDWSGGNGQTIWSDITKYDSDDENILTSTAGKVELLSDNIIDSDWNFFTWDIGGGEVTPIGNLNSSGGNPDSYIDITVPRGGNDEVGGFWEQSFTTYTNNPSSITVDFDYKVIDFNDLPNVADIRVYIDTLSGDPTTQVGSSISISGEGSWISAVTIDVTSAITTAGTYYLKIVFWVETPPGGGPKATGPFTIGYDNIELGSGGAMYKTFGYLISSAFDMSDLSPAQIIEWNEILPSGSEIRFQIQTAPDNSGLPGTWSTTWCGPEGEDGDETDYFTTSTGELIHIDHNGDQWIRYKTILSGDGSDTPVLEEIRINYK